MLSFVLRFSTTLKIKPNSVLFCNGSYSFFGWQGKISQRWPALFGPHMQLFFWHCKSQKRAKYIAKWKGKGNQGENDCIFLPIHVREETIFNTSGIGFAPWAGFTSTSNTKNPPWSKDASKTDNTLEVGMEMNKRWEAQARHN